MHIEGIAVRFLVSFSNYLSRMFVSLSTHSGWKLACNYFIPLSIHFLVISNRRMYKYEQTLFGLSDLLREKQ